MRRIAILFVIAAVTILGPVGGASALEVYGPCDTYLKADVSTNPPSYYVAGNLGCFY